LTALLQVVETRERLATGGKQRVELGDRSMVGQCPLEAFILVRIQVAQPDFSPAFRNNQNAAKANQLGGIGDGSGNDDSTAGRKTTRLRRPE
jgi:hypothetical protein